MLRMFAYGALSIVFVLYLSGIGLGAAAVGLLLTLTLLGDAAISLWLATNADRWGRRRTLLAGAALMAAGGAGFLAASRLEWLMAAAIVGVLSPSGSEIGPFLSVEQAALSELLPDDQRTRVFAWYNLAGSAATALGALAAGWGLQVMQRAGVGELDAYRAVLAGYSAAGAALAAVFAFLSPALEARPADAPARSGLFLGLHESKRKVAGLSALFGLDAFAGGFVLQSVLVNWFHVRFHADPGTLGTVFFGANLIAAASALMAHRIAQRVGLINTMVFTHLPSTVLLILVPLMPSLPLAIGMLLLRFSISQMDVPTRQSYTMMVVAPDERSAAAGVTGIARSLGAALAPVMGSAFLLAGAGTPFFVAGGLKIAYDLLLYRSFRRTENATR
ncbi:MAG: MFS transporter [Candidatus Eisenbacteria bacterium]|nr:MFS transporter [Candidatus Eisenbacteria bacterium]